MSRNHFDEVLCCLRFTDDTPPTYRDRFFETRKLVEAWNDNMAQNFTPMTSWICFLSRRVSYVDMGE
jgi:hypothetical protein